MKRKASVRLSRDQEREICRRVFKGGEDAQKVRAEFGISATRMSRITFGATKIKRYAVEAIYAGKRKKK